MGKVIGNSNWLLALVSWLWFVCICKHTHCFRYMSPSTPPVRQKWGLSFILLYFSAVFPTYRVCPTDMWSRSNNSGGVDGEAALVQSTSQELGLLTSCDKKEKSEVLVLNELIYKREEEVKLLRTYYAWPWLGIWYKLSNLVLTKTL